MKAAGQLVSGCGVCLFLLSGCGEPKDKWYEESSDVDRREKEYVDFQMKEAGMTETEAKKAWGLRYAIELTHQHKDLDVEGVELQNKIGE